MGRLVPLLVAGVVLLLAFLLPEASPARLSALSAHELFALPVGPEPSPGADDERPLLWQVVLDGPAARRVDGELVFALEETWADPTIARLSADNARELLVQPVGPEPAAGEPDDRPPLWKVVLDSPATETAEDGRVTRVYGTIHTAEARFRPVFEDIYWARVSLAEGLAELAAADPEYEDIVVQGRDSPVKGGGNFSVQLVGTAHMLEYTVDDADFEAVQVKRTWTPEATNDSVLRRGIARALREHADQNPEYASLRVEGEAAPAGAGGASFHLYVLGDDQYLTCSTANGQLARVERSWTPPGFGSLLPPLVAVALAILFRRPLVALFLGIFAGAYLLRRGAGDGLVHGLLGGLDDVFRNYFYSELVAQERYYIVGFVVFMLAMVGVMTVSGGIRGLMDAVARLARDVRRTQIATYLMGLAIFFDDYANTILVGSTMRPLTDRFRISREKLSYIVDSTAAPVAGLSIFSTWIAFEVSTFNAQLPAAGLQPSDGYAVFLGTIPYSFYCILTLVFVGLIVWSGRDLGPMLTAERRARATGQLLRPGATPMVSERATAMEPAAEVTPRAWRAVAPLLTFIGVTLFVIARDGGAFDMPRAELFTIEGITAVLYNGSGSYPLLVGSVCGWLVAVVGAFTARVYFGVLRASLTTILAMGVAFAILYLAWMIGAVCSDLGTASYLAALVGDTLDARLLPTLLFLLAGAVAFATGSSWSTMSILLPLVVGLAYTLGLGLELGPTEVESGRVLMTMCIGAVLSGAIFGDHCSPISDTTVMSSIASASDHIDHVRTQAPYATLCMLVAIGCGYLPATYLGLSPWIGLVAGSALLLAIVLFVARPSTGTEDEPAGERAPG